MLFTYFSSHAECGFKAVNRRAVEHIIRAGWRITILVFRYRTAGVG